MSSEGLWYVGSSSEDEDAPEEVTLKDSETAHHLEKEHQKDLAKKNKSKIKHKNKEKDELLKLQKEAKKARLDAVMLPTDILNDISDNEEEFSPPENQPPAGVRTQFDSDEDDDADSGINSLKNSRIAVSVVQSIKAPTFQAALDFKKLKQSGANSNIKRQTAKERQLMREKRKVQLRT